LYSFKSINKMVHIRFDPGQVRYEDYVQFGEGSPIESLDYFKGPMFQRGYGQSGNGVGDALRGIWRFFLPLIRKVGVTAAGEALNTGQRVLEQIKEGKPLKNTMIEEGRRGMDTVLEQGGFPKQFGTGRKGIKRNRNRHIPTHLTIIPQAIKKPIVQSKTKRLRSDAFGLY
jgi:hypothetical protein